MTSKLTRVAVTAPLALAWNDQSHMTVTMIAEPADQERPTPVD